MGDLNAGLFEIAGEGVDRAPGDPGLREYHTRLRDLAVETDARSRSACSAVAACPTSGASISPFSTRRRPRAAGCSRSVHSRR